MRDSILRKDIVGAILAKHPETRGDDRELILKVWESQGLTLTSEQQKAFKSALSAETIRRTRQKIQEEGYYKPTEEILHKRKQLADEYHNEFKKKRFIFDNVRQVAIQI